MYAPTIPQSPPTPSAAQRGRTRETPREHNRRFRRLNRRYTRQHLHLEDPDQDPVHIIPDQEQVHRNHPPPARTHLQARPQEPTYRRRMNQESYRRTNLPNPLQRAA